MREDGVKENKLEEDGMEEDGRKGYPTQEELELFIRQMEKTETYAPKHMKEQILSRAFPEKAFEKEPAMKLTYRLKIVVGMAASIAMLILIPFSKGGGYGAERTALSDRRENRVNINYVMNEKASQINRKVNLWFGNLFEANGGDLNEN